MLLNIRDKVTGWIAAVIFTLLIIPFALWGVNSYFEGAAEVVAISVNGKEISLRDYQREYQNIRQQWQNIANAPISTEVEPLLREETIKRLVQTELFRQAADDLGLSISDADVLETLQQIPAFNDENGFNMSLLEMAVGRVGMTPAGFKQQMKLDMTSEQFQSALVDSSFATQQEAAGFARLQKETRDIDYVVLSSDKAKENIEVSAEMIEKYYKENGDLFMEPEKVKLAYLVLSAGKIADDLFIEEGEVESWYEENRQNYEIAEQRHIRQIVVKLPQDADEQLVNKMLDRARSLRNDVQEGKTLEAVVTENTAGEEDSNIEFNEFEFLTRGILESEVDNTLFAMQEGDISEPVRSKYGFHIVELVKIKGGPSVSFAQVREQVAADVKLSKAEKLLYEKSDILATLAYEHPDTLEEAADALGLEILESDYISREDPGAGIVSDARVINAAFSDEVLKQGNNSDLLELAENRLMVLRVTDYQPVQKKPLDNVREQVITRIKYEVAAEQTRTQGETIIAGLREGAALEEVEQTHGIEFSEARGVRRDDTNVNRAVLRIGFNSGIPESGKPVISGTSLGSGDFAVAIVRDVQQLALTDLKKADINAMQDQLQQSQAAVNWAEFTSELKRSADVTVYEDVL